jgi:hypothetical protein
MNQRPQLDPGDRVRVVSAPRFSDAAAQVLSTDDEGVGAKDVERRGYDALATTIVRTYKGTQPAAVAAFHRDAEALHQFGYEPTAQSWAPGSWGCAAFLVALLLGVTPDGTLTVTYVRKETAAGAPVPRSLASSKSEPLAHHRRGAQGAPADTD